ncbi:MAG: transketolase [Candidatus Dadabacteria bacterium]|nr:MAG: transketolase [Candidatus Dadabacteria bacterium]
MDIESVRKVANTVRVLSMEAVQRAKSGHPGMPMGAADYASYLWAKVLRFNPADPRWIMRDRFVLSAGHGSMLLYSLLHLFGFSLSLDQLKNFRQWGSLTPGHPEFGLTPGVETTTGPLGQGFANGVGMALGGKLLADRFGEKFEYRVFGIVSDGDLMEGISYEAASLAGHLGLSNLVYFYDDNEISIGGSTDITFTENVPERFKAAGWKVLDINGHNLDGIASALEEAVSEKEKPTLIVAHTVIAYPSPNKAGTPESHGAPLGEEEVKETKKRLGWPLDKEFFIPEEVKDYIKKCLEEKTNFYNCWQSEFSEWKKVSREKASLLEKQINKEIDFVSLRRGLIEELQGIEKDSTRNLSGRAIQVIARSVPWFLGGSADLEPSNKTLIKDSSDIQSNNFSGRNIRFGVREHSMGAIVNGLSYSGLWSAFSATFLVFLDYMRAPVRLAALSHLPSLFIFTHDSFYVGEDGPTHQPIEHITTLRCMPNIFIFRPADGLEVAACYEAALKIKDAPSVLLFTRQSLPKVLRDREDCYEDILKGGYVVRSSADDSFTILATGSEVSLALDSAKLLEERGVRARVVSVPCYELFMKQKREYRLAVIPEGHKIVAIEASTPYFWQGVVGRDGLVIGMNRYGASAPAAELAKHFGFTPQSVSDKILNWYGHT